MTSRQITHIRAKGNNITLCLIDKGNNSISFEHAKLNPVKHVDSLIICTRCKEEFTERSE